MNWYLEVIKKYFVFNGRARRKEYWMFVLFNIIFTIIAMILDNILGITIENIYYGPIYMIYTLAILIPSLAVIVRRLHDTGRSGLFILILLIPLIGPIWFFVLMILEGNAGDNQYGADPKVNG